MTGDYAFIYADDEVLVSLPLGVTEWIGRAPNGAVLQVVDSPTALPVPSPTDPVPKRYMLLTWYPVVAVDVAEYELYIDGGLIVTRPKGEPFYQYLTPRLDSGNHTFSVKSVDTAGNKATVSILTLEIGEIPPPTSGMIITQTVPGSGSFNLEWTPPSGW